MTTAVKRRRIARPVQSEQAKLAQDMRELYILELRKQLLDNKVKAKLAALKKKVKALDDQELTAPIVIEGKRVPLRAAFDEITSESNQSTVDTKKLFEDFGVEDFLEMATVTQKAITDTHGAKTTAKYLKTKKVSTAKTTWSFGVSN